MDDLVFVVEEDQLLRGHHTAIKEQRMRRLELRAMVEEVVDAENADLVERGIRTTSRNNHVFGTDAFHYVPPKGK